MKKLFLLVAVVIAPAIAHAQPGEPNPDVGSVEQNAAQLNPEPTDPTEHFNWFGFQSGHLFDYLGKDEYGGKFGDDVMTRKDGSVVKNEKGEKEEEEAASPPFIFMLINFGIFLLILGKTLWPAGQKMSAERSDQIKNALDEAAKLRDQAANKLAEYETRIKDVDAEVQKIVADIRAGAEEDKKRILESAERQAKQMKHDAELRIAAEIEMARARLSREVAVAATSATEKLLKTQVTPDDQKKLVGNFISGMGA
jgi:F-type H+-transporting ATPase subunit b